MSAYDDDVINGLHALGMVGGALLPVGAVVIALLVGVVSALFWKGLL
jgi:hypothetical protein